MHESEWTSERFYLRTLCSLSREVLNTIQQFYSPILQVSEPLYSLFISVSLLSFAQKRITGCELAKCQKWVCWSLSSAGSWKWVQEQRNQRERDARDFPAGEREREERCQRGERLIMWVSFTLTSSDVISAEGMLLLWFSSYRFVQGRADRGVGHW